MNNFECQLSKVFAGKQQSCFHSLDLVEQLSDASHLELVAPLSAKLMQMCYRTRRRVRMKKKGSSPRPWSRWPVKGLLPQPSLPPVPSGWHQDVSMKSLVFLPVQITLKPGFATFPQPRAENSWKDY